MTSIPPAIVLSDGTGGLGAVRSLARRGVEVIVIAYDPIDPALQSRYPSKKMLLAGSDEEKETELLRILDSLPNQGAVLLTNSDRLVDVISRYRQELSGKYRIQLPPRDILDALNDKKQETRLISSLGFDVPKTVQDLPQNPADLEKQLRFPIIFKPYMYAAVQQFPKKNEVVKSSEALFEFYRQWKNAIPFLLAQEVIPGPDSYSWISSCTFDRDYELLDCGIKQKLRAYPAHFGGSTFAVSRENVEILELTRLLGQKLKYVGHAGVEFRWDDRDSRYKYLEVNPRLPANVGFDEACGLPTVWNSYQVSIGNDASHSGLKQKEGLYFLDLKFDLLSLLADKTPIGKIMIEYFQLLFKPTSGMYFAWDDPKPALALASRIIIRGMQKMVGKIIRRPSISVRPIKD